MSWTEQPLLGFDTETTGVDTANDRIVTVSLVEYHAGKCLRARGSLINPGVEIPAGATEVHGITNEEAAERGRPPEEVLAKVVAAMHEAYRADVPLVAFNLRFDWQLIHAECERHGIDAPPPMTCIDPYIMDKTLDKYRKGSRKLTAVAKHYDVPLLDAHTASADALAACGVARQIGRTYPAAGDLTPEELHRKQVLWFIAWKDGFNDYLARKAKADETPDFVTGEWPR